MKLHLTAEEKLNLLRAADLRRKWYTLDDQRVCVLCDKAITGRQIVVTANPQGGYILRCPTPDCVSTPNDWFYQGSGFSAKASTVRMSEASLWTE